MLSPWQGRLVITEPMKKPDDTSNLVWLFDDPMVITEPKSGLELLLFLDTGAMNSHCDGRIGIDTAKGMSMHIDFTNGTFDIKH